MSALKSLSFVLAPFKMVFHALSLSITVIVELLRELRVFVNISTKKMMFLAGFLLKERQSSPPVCVCLSTFILLHGTAYSFFANLWPSLTSRSLLKKFMGISLNGLLPGPIASVNKSLAAVKEYLTWVKRRPFSPQFGGLIAMVLASVPFQLSRCADQ